MILVSTVGYPIEGSIIIFLGLALGNSFGTWEGYFIGVSLGALGVSMIDTGEGYLVGLSLGLPIGTPIEYQNPWHST